MCYLSKPALTRCCAARKFRSGSVGWFGPFWLLVKGCDGLWRGPCEVTLNVVPAQYVFYFMCESHHSIAGVRTRCPAQVPSTRNMMYLGFLTSDLKFVRMFKERYERKTERAAVIDTGSISKTKSPTSPKITQNWPKIQTLGH